jgi:EAL domain-containing protein (putative c-di-GMP-specific phosphodiesterase class I)
MLENSLDAVRRLPAPARAVPVAVNISPKSLLSHDLVRVIESMMGVDPGLSGLLELEITESGLMEDPRQSLDVLRELSRLGIALYIDDFGTGYSSLAYLQKLPVKAIKIDRSFVAAMTGDPDSAKIVRSTIDLAHGLGLKVVAEGVEDRDTLERLADYRCDEAQGYYIARPMAPDRFALWLAAHSVGVGPAR